MKRYDKFACGFGLAVLTGLCGCNVHGRVHSTSSSDKDGNVNIHIEGGDSEGHFSLNIKGKFGKTVTQTVEEKYNAAKVETLKVTETAGSVTISPTIETADEVRITAIKHVSGDESESLLKPYLKRIKSMVKFENGTLNVYTERDEKQFADHNGWIEYKIEVPKRLAAQIQTGSGNVKMEGIEGKIAVETASGAIELARLGGEIHAKASSGDISLKSSELTDKLELETTSGKITTEGVRAKNKTLAVSLTSSSGDIDYTGFASTLKMESTSGKQTANLSSDSTLSQINAHASSGDIALGLPKATKADLDYKTSSGNIELTGTDNDSPDENASKTTIGGGGFPITLETTSGSLTVEVQ